MNARSMHWNTSGRGLRIVPPRVKLACRPSPFRDAWSHQLLLVLLLALGCGGADSAEVAGNASVDGSFTGTPHVELGQGELMFAALADDEALPYAAGSQGGHHVFVSFRASSLDPTRVHVKVTTSVLNRPELDLTREGRVNFGDANESGGDGPSYDFAGWPAQILMAPCHVGEAVRIDVSLTDLDMREAHDSRTIRIARPDAALEVPCP